MCASIWPNLILASQGKVHLAKTSNRLAYQQQKRRMHTDLPEPVWAAALAANWDRKVKDLVDDIYGDHNYMVLLLDSLPCCWHAAALTCGVHITIMVSVMGIHNTSGVSCSIRISPSPPYPHLPPPLSPSALPPCNTRRQHPLKGSTGSYRQHQ